MPPNLPPSRNTLHYDPTFVRRAGRGCFWLLALVIAAVGLTFSAFSVTMVWLGWRAGDADTVSFFAMFGSFGLFAMVTSLWQVVRYGRAEVRVDDQTLTTREGWRTRRFRLADIRGCTYDADPDRTSVRLALVNGEAPELVLMRHFPAGDRAALAEVITHRVAASAVNVTAPGPSACPPGTAASAATRASPRRPVPPR